MTREEILRVLKEGANFSIDEKGFGYGAINNFPECKIDSGMTNFYYNLVHYPAKAKLLESLDWNVVENPRNPKDSEYPSEDGEYITMMDCNEHEICVNTFKDGNFSWMNKTHIKWWMKLPEN